MKKILVKLPPRLDDLAYCWPFIELLKREKGDDQVQVIYDKKLSPWHEWPLEGLKSYKLSQKERSLLGVHKYSVKEHDVFNIDIYIDLEGSLISAYLGYCFKAKQRFGISDSSWAKIFYHHRVFPDNTTKKDHSYIKVLEKAYERNFSSFKWSPEVTLPDRPNDLFTTFNPRDCHLVILNKLNDETLDFWGQFLNGFHGQKFILVGLEQSFALRDLHQELTEENEFFYELSFDFNRIQALIQLCRGIICDESWLGTLFGVMGLKTLYMGREKLSSVEHVDVDLQAMALSEVDPQTACDKVHKAWEL